MRFLVDRCVGTTLVKWLRAGGHDVLDARDLGADPGDAALLDMGAGDSRVVVTLDADFGLLVFNRRMPHAGFVRLPDVPPAERIRLLQIVLELHGDELAKGAIVTVRGGRIRITHL